MRMAAGLALIALLWAAPACKQKKNAAQTAQQAKRIPISVGIGDPRSAQQLVSGFYDIEDGACWLNRWRDVVVRIPVGGPNINGWRPMHTAFFEGPAFYFYRGQSDEAFANRIGAAALALCKQYGAVCGLGNGGASLLKGGAR